MQKALIMLNILMLNACVYTETPYGKAAVIDLPVQNQTVVHKNIHIHAPPGSTVIYQEAQPIQPIYRR
ncbi:methionine-binding protein [Neisseria zoodegmatis]|uniref:Methionine-binding protein n=1 Tax=Neisseria zoodegmatis TaxID=326523 RepID=A0AB38DS27_9NEIS|nr:methionine-binding protein [Neisseria zoodegmatis]OSI11006.1 methionine-binding protein [Neisseria zoodegmatis]SNU80254.1 Uncharacterised protein [Neisseria zoodegmatis]